MLKTPAQDHGCRQRSRGTQHVGFRGCREDAANHGTGRVYEQARNRLAFPSQPLTIKGQAIHLARVAALAAVGRLRGPAQGRTPWDEKLNSWRHRTHKARLLQAETARVPSLRRAASAKACWAG